MANREQDHSSALFYDLFYDAYELVYADKIAGEHRLEALQTELSTTINAVRKTEIECDIEDLKDDLDDLAKREQKLDETYERFGRLHSDADRGIKTKEAASRGGVARAVPYKEKRREWQTQAKDIWKINPQMSKKAVAKKIAEGPDDSPETIRRLIHKPI